MKADPKPSNDTSGTDEALAALQSSLASYEQEKQANQTNITNSILPTSKSRFDAARKNKQERRPQLGLSPAGTPPLSASGTPKVGAAPTSAPLTEAAVRARAMKTPVLHLLAMKSASTENIIEKTHVPKEDLDNILQKIGKQVDGKWQLSDRAYKDLDVWTFGYTSQEDRQMAVDNAVRAYDRLRIGKDEKIWQTLLPKKDRGKGTVLSKLHLGNRGLTPQYAASPLLHIDGAGDGKATPAGNTPRLGASTPRPNSAKGDVTKRLLSKDPKRARAIEEAKEKKRKERDAAASDREGGRPAKRQATKKEVAKAKSTEFVHSSDDDSESDGAPKERVTRVDSKTDSESLSVKPIAKPKAKAPPAASPDSSDVVVKTKKAADKPSAKARPEAVRPKASASPAVRAARPAVTTGKSTPRVTNNLSAPNSQQKPQRSPQKPDSRPNVPSPLGAARPRVASDVADRNAVGIQRSSNGLDAPKSTGTPNGMRKRQDTVTSTASISSFASDKKSPETTAVKPRSKPVTNGTSPPKPPLTNGTTHKPEQGTKRKSDSPPLHQNGDSHKHRKTASTSSQSKSQSNSTARTSPDLGGGGGSSSDSTASVLESITYMQGVTLAEKFREVYYPAYAKMYDELEARGVGVGREERERLWAMHKRLEQMKREIEGASGREGRGE